jgi:hypothetical protein
MFCSNKAPQDEQLFSQTLSWRSPTLREPNAAKVLIILHGFGYVYSAKKECRNVVKVLRIAGAEGLGRQCSGQTRGFAHSKNECRLSNVLE